MLLPNDVRRRSLNTKTFLKHEQALQKVCYLATTILTAIFSQKLSKCIIMMMSFYLFDLIFYFFYQVGLVFCTLYTFTYRTTWCVFPFTLIGKCAFLFYDVIFFFWYTKKKSTYTFKIVQQYLKALEFPKGIRGRAQIQQNV